MCSAKFFFRKTLVNFTAILDKTPYLILNFWLFLYHAYKSTVVSKYYEPGHCWNYVWIRLNREIIWYYRHSPCCFHAWEWLLSCFFLYNSVFNLWLFSETITYFHELSLHIRNVILVFNDFWKFSISCHLRINSLSLFRKQVERSFEAFAIVMHYRVLLKHSCQETYLTISGLMWIQTFLTILNAFWRLKDPSDPLERIISWK